MLSGKRTRAIAAREKEEKGLSLPDRRKRRRAVGGREEGCRWQGGRGPLVPGKGRRRRAVGGREEGCRCQGGGRGGGPLLSGRRRRRARLPGNRRKR